MATLTADHSRATRGEHRFFLVTAWMLAVLVPGGFLFNLAMGRSSLELPLIYHVHAFAFFGWVVIYATQATLGAKGNIAVHMRLGQIAFLWIPLMLVLGVWLTFVTLQVLGGPPFFSQSEFLAVNLLHLAAFGGLAFAAVAMRRNKAWHKRLMFGAMATVGAPGIARLLPLPFLVPYVFHVLFAVMALFPVAGMVMDKRVHGKIHPAWWWALLVPVAALLVGEAIGATGYAHNWVADHVAGTPGGERPAGPFMPPGM